jgi:quinolinate synthase
MKTHVENVEYHDPVLCETKHIFAKIPQEPSLERRAYLKQVIPQLLKKNEALLVAHYYVHPDVQDLAESTGGVVADSLEMARFGAKTEQSTLIVAGVRFMGETAKILSPHKTILMPSLEADCSLDLGCPSDAFRSFREQYPHHTVVVYANTSAAVKAQADWVVTSGCALEIVNHLKNSGQKILWAPDQHLGAYIQEKTKADMVLWMGSCIVHDEFKAIELDLLKQQYPTWKVLVHPESPRAVIQLADYVGSTSGMIREAKRVQAPGYIVATDKGLLHQLKKAVPEAQWIPAPTAGESATCKSCAHCPWMAMNELENLYALLQNPAAAQSIQVDHSLILQAQLPIQRMLDFTASRIQSTALGIGPA